MHSICSYSLGIKYLLIVPKWIILSSCISILVIGSGVLSDVGFIRINSRHTIGIARNRIAALYGLDHEWKRTETLFYIIVAIQLGQLDKAHIWMVFAKNKCQNIHAILYLWVFMVIWHSIIDNLVFIKLLSFVGVLASSLERKIRSHE